MEVDNEKLKEEIESEAKRIVDELYKSYDHPSKEQKILYLAREVAVLHAHVKNLYSKINSIRTSSSREYPSDHW